MCSSKIKDNVSCTSGCMTAPSSKQAALVLTQATATAMQLHRNVVARSSAGSDLALVSQLRDMEPLHCGCVQLQFSLALGLHSQGCSHVAGPAGHVWMQAAYNNANQAIRHSTCLSCSLKDAAVSIHVGQDVCLRTAQPCLQVSPLVYVLERVEVLTSLLCCPCCCVQAILQCAWHAEPAGTHSNNKCCTWLLLHVHVYRSRQVGSFRHHTTGYCRFTNCDREPQTKAMLNAETEN